MTKKFKLIGLIALTGILYGCGEVSKNAETDISKTLALADSAKAKPTPIASFSAFRDVDTPLLGHYIKEDGGDPLPPIWEKKDGFTLAKEEEMTLAAIAAKITSKTHIPTNLDPRINERFDSLTQSDQAVNRPAQEINPGVAGNLMPRGTLMAQYGAYANTPASKTIVPDFTGTLSGFLSYTANAFDVSWRYRSGTIYFDRYTTKTFNINATPDNYDISSTITATTTQTSSTGTASAGNAGQSTKSAAKIDLWTDLDHALTGIVRGGKVTVSTSTGTVTVTATPRQMTEVENYIEQLNAFLKPRILVEVAAFFITISDNDNYGLDLNAVYNAGLGGKGGYNLALQGLVPALATAPGSSSFGVLAPTTAGQSSHFAGSQVFYSALTGAGRLTDYRTGSTITRNGNPSPVQLTTSEDFLNSITFNTVSAAVGSTSATPVTKDFGFNLQVLPKITGHGEVTVLFHFSESSLTNTTNVTVNSTQLTLTTIDKRATDTDLPIASGETLVLTGYEQDQVSRTLQGIGDASFWGLGGQNQTTITRTRLILLVTPTILDIPKLGRTAGLGK